MFCPHCHNKIPDGSNICPLCYSNLAGVKPQQSREEPQTGAQQQKREGTSAQPRAKKPAYTKGSRGGKKSADRTPMIIAFGLIVILIIIIAMIVRSMFGAGGTPAAANTPIPQATATPAQNFIVFGATATPNPQAVTTPTPRIEVTPTPAPQEPVQTSYKTLRKNDQGAEVIMLQQALVELGYLSGATDGIYGTGTMTAVKNFQKDHELDDDGIAGQQTLSLLYSLVKITPMPDVTAGPGDIMDLPG